MYQELEEEEKLQIIWNTFFHLRGFEDVPVKPLDLFSNICLTKAIWWIYLM